MPGTFPTLGAVLLVVLLGDAAPAGADQPPPADGSPRHWSFTAPVRPAVPTVKNAAWVRNPIDAFIAAEHEKRGLGARPEADKATLLRRVYLDLIGLPPTREQLHAFLADNSPDAYPRVVDQLLASPGYGQRWGRHWMDVWRYSDWAGYGMEVRDSQPFLWRWRDWIVESLNADKGYDRMVQEMLAGDEIAPGDPQIVRATGYLARSYYKFNRNVWLENVVEHTGKAFLGLTLNCARCHDHKYDPISQKETYEFRAIFEPYNIRTDPVPGQLDTAKDGFTHVYDADATTKTFLFLRGNEMTPDTEPLSPAIPAFLGGKFAIHPIDLPATAWYPGLRPSVQHDLLAADDGAIATAEQALAATKKTRDLARRALDVSRLPAEEPCRNKIVFSFRWVPWASVLACPCSEGSEASESKSAQAAFFAAGREVVLADFHVTEAKAQRTADAAKIAADSARYAIPPAANASQLALAASRAELEAKVVKAEEDLFLSLSSALAPKSATPAKAPRAKTKVAEKKPLDAVLALRSAMRALENAPPTYTPLTPVYPSATTGRRLALARWITARANPLAARVAVNHIWMRHFGQPLVETVFDFGKNGRPPAMPRLLDWLAVELMEPSVSCGQSSAESPAHPWSMKHLHRLIVTSSAYRMQSSDAGDETDGSMDPDNQFIWRMNPRRLEAEAVRDSLLFISGQLDLTMGGPDIDQNAGLTTPRRSIYFRSAYEKQMVFLKLFDGPNPAECYRRMPTVMPQQALALANSPLAQSAARKLAAALTSEAGAGQAHDRVFVAAAFEQILCRQPTAAEQSACTAFLKDQAARLKDAKNLSPFASGDSGALKPSSDIAQRAREDLVQVLLNHSDFVTIR